MRRYERIRCRSANPFYYLSVQGKLNLDLHILQSSYPGVCLPVTALFLRVSPLCAGAGRLFLLPLVSASWHRDCEEVRHLSPLDDEVVVFIAIVSSVHRG